MMITRQNEWEDYRSYHPNVIQGDLADPLYFDFISFCQYAVIANKMRRGKMDFIEKVAIADVNHNNNNTDDDDDDDDDDL